MTAVRRPGNGAPPNVPEDLQVQRSGNATANPAPGGTHSARNAQQPPRSPHEQLSERPLQRRLNAMGPRGTFHPITREPMSGNSSQLHLPLLDVRTDAADALARSQSAGDLMRLSRQPGLARTKSTPALDRLEQAARLQEHRQRMLAGEEVSSDRDLRAVEEKLKELSMPQHSDTASTGAVDDATAEVPYSGNVNEKTRDGQRVAFRVTKEFGTTLYMQDMNNGWDIEQSNGVQLEHGVNGAHVIFPPDPEEATAKRPGHGEPVVVGRIIPVTEGVGTKNGIVARDLKAPEGYHFFQAVPSTGGSVAYIVKQDQQPGVEGPLDQALMWHVRGASAAVEVPLPKSLEGRQLQSMACDDKGRMYILDDMGNMWRGRPDTVIGEGAGKWRRLDMPEFEKPIKVETTDDKMILLTCEPKSPGGQGAQYVLRNNMRWDGFDPAERNSLAVFDRLKEKDPRKAHVTLGPFAHKWSGIKDRVVNASPKAASVLKQAVSGITQAAQSTAVRASAALQQGATQLASELVDYAASPYAPAQLQIATTLAGGALRMFTDDKTAADMTQKTKHAVVKYGGWALETAAKRGVAQALTRYLMKGAATNTLWYAHVAFMVAPSVINMRDFLRKSVEPEPVAGEQLEAQGVWDRFGNWRRAHIGVRTETGARNANVRAELAAGKHFIHNTQARIQSGGNSPIDVHAEIRQQLAPKVMGNLSSAIDKLEQALGKRNKAGDPVGSSHYRTNANFKRFSQSRPVDNDSNVLQQLYKQADWLLGQSGVEGAKELLERMRKLITDDRLVFKDNEWPRFGEVTGLSRHDTLHAFCGVQLRKMAHDLALSLKGVASVTQHRMDAAANDYLNRYQRAAEVERGMVAELAEDLDSIHEGPVNGDFQRYEDLDSYVMLNDPEVVEKQLARDAAALKQLPAVHDAAATLDQADIPVLNLLKQLYEATMEEGVSRLERHLGLDLDDELGAQGAAQEIWEAGRRGKLQKTPPAHNKDEVSAQGPLPAPDREGVAVAEEPALHASTAPDAPEHQGEPADQPAEGPQQKGRRKLHKPSPQERKAAILEAQKAKAADDVEAQVAAAATYTHPADAPARPFRYQDPEYLKHIESPELVWSQDNALFLVYQRRMASLHGVPADHVARPDDLGRLKTPVVHEPAEEGKLTARLETMLRLGIYLPVTSKEQQPDGHVLGINVPIPGTDGRSIGIQQTRRLDNDMSIETGTLVNHQLVFEKAAQAVARGKSSASNDDWTSIGAGLLKEMKDNPVSKLYDRGISDARAQRLLIAFLRMFELDSHPDSQMMRAATMEGMIHPNQLLEWADGYVRAAKTGQTVGYKVENTVGGDGDGRGVSIRFVDRGTQGAREHPGEATTKDALNIPLNSIPSFQPLWQFNIGKGRGLAVTKTASGFDVTLNRFSKLQLRPLLAGGGKMMWGAGRVGEHPVKTKDGKASHDAQALIYWGGEVIPNLCNWSQTDSGDITFHLTENDFGDAAYMVRNLLACKISPMDLLDAASSIQEARKSSKMWEFGFDIHPLTAAVAIFTNPENLNNRFKAVAAGLVQTSFNWARTWEKESVQGGDDAKKETRITTNRHTMSIVAKPIDVTEIQQSWQIDKDSPFGKTLFSAGRADLENHPEKKASHVGDFLETEGKVPTWIKLTINTLGAWEGDQPTVTVGSDGRISQASRGRTLQRDFDPEHVPQLNHLRREAREEYDKLMEVSKLAKAHGKAVHVEYELPQEGLEALKSAKNWDEAKKILNDPSRYRIKGVTVPGEWVYESGHFSGFDAGRWNTGGSNTFSDAAKYASIQLVYPKKGESKKITSSVQGVFTDEIGDRAFAALDKRIYAHDEYGRILVDGDGIPLLSTLEKAIIGMGSNPARILLSMLDETEVPTQQNMQAAVAAIADASRENARQDHVAIVSGDPVLRTWNAKSRTWAETALSHNQLSLLLAAAPDSAAVTPAPGRPLDLVASSSAAGNEDAASIGSASSGQASVRAPHEELQAPVREERSLQKGQVPWAQNILRVISSASTVALGVDPVQVFGAAKADKLRRKAVQMSEGPLHGNDMPRHLRPRSLWRPLHVNAILRAMADAHQRNPAQPYLLDPAQEHVLHTYFPDPDPAIKHHDARLVHDIVQDQSRGMLAAFRNAVNLVAGRREPALRSRLEPAEVGSGPARPGPTHTTGTVIGGLSSGGL